MENEIDEQCTELKEECAQPRRESLRFTQRKRKVVRTSKRWKKAIVTKGIKEMEVVCAQIFINDTVSNTTGNTVATRSVYKFGKTHTSSYCTRDKHKQANYLPGKDSKMTMCSKKTKRSNR